MSEVVLDFNNGYGIIKLYANDLNGYYGEIFNTLEEANKEYPESYILEGFAVYDISTGFIPDNCRDWNDSLKDAIKEYRMTIIPQLNVSQEIKRIKGIPFMKRSGAEQSKLYNHWYSTNVNESIWDYMGMTFEDFDLWRTGSLLLNDGSFKKMEDSFYKITDKSLELARALIECDFNEVGCQVINERLLDSLRESNDNITKFGPIINDKRNKFIFFFDPGDDLAAIVSKDACFHKEDFAYYMEFAELLPTEKNFEKVFDKIVNNSCNAKGNMSLADCVMAAINKVKDEKKATLENRLIEAEKTSIDNNDLLLIKTDNLAR